jgi:hypothetical protein
VPKQGAVLVGHNHNHKLCTAMVGHDGTMAAVYVVTAPGCKGAGRHGCCAVVGQLACEQRAHRSCRVLKYLHCGGRGMLLAGTARGSLFHAVRFVCASVTPVTRGVQGLCLGLRHLL